MAIKLLTESTVINMHPNDGFNVELTLLDLDNSDFDVSSEDYMIRFSVKSLTQFTMPDTTAMYHGIAEKTDIPNVINLIFDADNTNFPVSKKPYYLIVQISNKKFKFSREFYYALYVFATGMTSTY